MIEWNRHPACKCPSWGVAFDCPLHATWKVPDGVGGEIWYLPVIQPPSIPPNREKK
jgi:hypothetical protein